MSNAELLDRLPPQNLEAENGLLGSLMLDMSHFDKAAAAIRDTDFYADANQRLFRHLAAMADDGHRKCDPTILAERLRRGCEYEAVGGAAYIADLLQSVPYSHNAGYYASIVRAKAKRRAMINAATVLLRNAWDDAMADAEIIGDADKALTEIATGREARDVWTSEEAVQACFDNIDATIERGETTGIPTGFRTFDEEIGGLFPGELTILGARSSIGKTAMAMQIAQWNAARGRLVYFVSLEMSLLNLITRELCAAAKVNSVRVRSGQLDADERGRLVAAGSKIAKRSLVIDDRPSLKTSDIFRKARQLARQKLQLVVVDYTQFVTPEDGKLVREQQVSNITKGLKALAKELNVAVLSLSALNKEAEKQGSAKLSHLRESDGQGFTADVVMTLERGDKGTPQETEAYLKVLKNRNGPTGKFEMEWIPHRTRFACRGEEIPDPDREVPTNREMAFDQFGGSNGEF